VARKGTSARVSAKARDELSRSVIALLMKEPFFGHLLGGVVRSVTDSTPTAAVALTKDSIELRVNPTFFVKTIRRKNERVAIIKHEALHLVFKHLFRWKSHHNPRLYNIAADLVVNQLVHPWPLPEGAITLAMFPDMGIKPNQTVDWYYKKLMNLQSQRGRKGAPKSADALGELMEGTRHSDHQFWADSHSNSSSDKTGESTRRALESELERQIIQARDRGGARSWGLLPGAVQAAISTMIEQRKPAIDWRRSLRLFSNSSRRTRITINQQRESKRFESLPGLRRYPGLKVKRLQHMLVAIDTSGSVSDSDLALFFAEVHGIWRQGAQVDVIECDAAVQRVYPYKGRPPSGIMGRGGTVFDPVFQWLRDNRRARYDGCIYITDGYAAAPQIKPPCRLLWVVTSGGSVGPHLRFGRAITLPAS